MYRVCDQLGTKRLEHFAGIGPPPPARAVALEGSGALLAPRHSRYNPDVWVLLDSCQVRKRSFEDKGKVGNDLFMQFEAELRRVQEDRYLPR